MRSSLDLSSLAPDAQKHLGRLRSRAGPSGRRWGSLGQALGSIGGMYYDNAVADRAQETAIGAEQKTRDGIRQSVGLEDGKPPMRNRIANALTPKTPSADPETPDWKPFSQPAKSSPAASGVKPDFAKPAPSAPAPTTQPTASTGSSDLKQRVRALLESGSYENRLEAQRLISEHKAQNSPRAIRARRLNELRIKKAERDLSGHMSPMQKVQLERATLLLDQAKRNTPEARLKVGAKIGLTGRELQVYGATGSMPTVAPNADLKRQKLQAEIKKLNDGDPLKAAKVKLLQQLMGGQEAPTGVPQPQLLPQSNETTERLPQAIPTGAEGNPVSDPNVIRTQTAAPGQQPPASPMDNLSPTQRQAMALNLVSPGMGNALLKDDKAAGFGTATKNKIEGKVFDTAEGMARLNGIQKSFRPEFMTMGGGIKAGWIKMVDKIRAGGMKPTPEQTKYLTEYTQFKQDAWDNLNRYIKEITGAQMSEAEAARLMRSMPNPGTSFYDGDSPAEFKAKMDNTVRQLKLSAARYNYLRSAKFKGRQMVGPNGQSRISLQQMRGVIEKRAQEIAREMKRANPDMDGNLIRAQADQATLKEFGI